MFGTAIIFILTFSKQVKTIVARGPGIWAKVLRARLKGEVSPRCSTDPYLNLFSPPLSGEQEAV